MRLREHQSPDLYAFYERVAAAHSPMKARVALARKFACISWYMVMNGEPFSPARTAQHG